MKKLGFLGTLIAIAVLLTQVASFAFAAPPNNEQDKGPPTLEKMVFVHYRVDFAPGKPEGSPGVGPAKPDKNKTLELYEYSKFHWLYTTASEGIKWYYNTGNMPSDYEQAVIESFAAWDSIGEAEINFDYQNTTSNEPGWDQYAAPDGYNVVGWDNISQLYPDAIGVTVVWYYRYIKGEKIIYECDTVLNSNSEYAWTCTDWIEDTEFYYDVDVQNIMTHEAGHWLMLDDLYDTIASEQTMYGYADEAELKKRSLEEGDKAGIKAIY